MLCPVLYPAASYFNKYQIQKVIIYMHTALMDIYYEFVFYISHYSVG